MRRRKTLLIFTALTVGLATGSFACKSGQTEPASDKTEIIVAAATSLRKALPAVVEAFSKDHPGARVTATYGASGDLEKQVEGGASVDLVIFAAGEPVDRLIHKGLVDPATRRVLATNELVLVGPIGGPSLTFRTLDALPAGERLAIGDPRVVPAGKYARDALDKLGLWPALSTRVVLGGNVAAVLAYVERGEVPAAIVYRTEIEGAKGVRVLDVAKGEWAPRPEVVAGVVKGRGDGARARQATELLDFLGSPGGLRILEQYGFGSPR